MKKRINIILEEAIIDDLNRMANERGLSRSSLLSVLIWNEANSHYTEDFYKSNAVEAYQASHIY